MFITWSYRAAWIFRYSSSMSSSASFCDGWYLTEEMADFFASIVRKQNDAHLLWLTMGSRERVQQLMSARGIGEENFSIHSVPPKDMPSYLAAGDIGISFIKRCFSKLASSPTKNGEYLACGLPIVINSGIGDSDALSAIVIDDFNEQDFNAAWTAIEAAVNDPNVRTKSRAVAEKVFDLKTVGAETYARLYKSVFSA